METELRVSKVYVLSILCKIFLFQRVKRLAIQSVFECGLVPVAFLWFAFRVKFSIFFKPVLFHVIIKV